MVQWVFWFYRWQEKSLLCVNKRWEKFSFVCVCVWPITNESRENSFKKIVIFVQGENYVIIIESV